MDAKKETKQTYRVVFRAFRATNFEEDGILNKRFYLRTTRKPVSSLSISPKGVVECGDKGYDGIPARSKPTSVELTTDKKQFEPDNYLELFMFSDKKEMTEVLVDGSSRAQPILALIHLCLGKRALDLRVVEDTQEITLEYENENSQSLVTGSRIRFSFHSKCGTHLKLLNERAFPEVNLFPNGMEPLGKTFDVYFKLEEPVQKRIEIALRWFYKALQERVIEDKFLALWISFEALTMDETNKLSKAKHFLANMLNIHVDHTDLYLEIGRMCAHRGNLVHGRALDIQLSRKYCSKLMDVVEETLRWSIGMESQEKLKKYL